MAIVEKMKDMGMKDDYPMDMPSGKKNKKRYPSLSVEDIDMKGKGVGDEMMMHARCKITEVSQEDGRPKRIRLEVKKARMEGKMKGKHRMPDGSMMEDKKMETSDKKEWGEKGWEKKKGKKGKSKKGKGRKFKKGSKESKEYMASIRKGKEA